MKQVYLLSLIFLTSINCESDLMENQHASIITSPQSSANNVSFTCANDNGCDIKTKVLYSQRKICFDNWSQGTYAYNRYYCDFGNITSNLLGEERGYVIESGGADVLKIKMPKDQVGAANTGITASTMIPSNDEYYLYYRIWFDPEYDFTSGFKLPGFCGGTCNTGGFQVTSDTDGWSFRLMARESDNDPGKASVFPYVYHSRMNQQYGENFNLLANEVLETGKWHGIQIYIKTNNPCSEERDGEFKVWIDDQLLFHQTNIRYTEGTSRIDKVLFHIFHGGATSEYAPSKDQHLRINEFKWWRN